jgi:nitroreductase
MADVRALVPAVVEAATRAPSVHNTQPWRFVAHDDVVELWDDPARGLPVLDPDGRARLISCGAALALAEVAAAGLGVSTGTTLLPDSGTPEHLADLQLGDARTPDDAQRALAAAIGRRHTERGAFDESVDLPPETVRALASAVEANGCLLRVVESSDDAAAVTVLLARADVVQSRDPAYRDELRQWTGRDPDSPDGIPASAVPSEAPAERGSSYRLRDFDADRGDQGPQRAGEPPRAEHPLVVVIGTAADDAAAWLAAGQALGRLLLTATTRGLAASPMTQALEVQDTRARLARDLGLVGHPQVVLRLGLAAPGSTAAVGHANRRSVAEVLETR